MSTLCNIIFVSLHYLLTKTINTYTTQVYIRIVESAPAENTHG